MTTNNNSPWKLTITRAKQRSWSAGNGPKPKVFLFSHDTRYKSYTRWEHKLKNVSVITNLKVEKTDKFTLAPGDSYTVVLKIRGIAEKTMGTIDCVTPLISYNPKGWLGNITKSDVYVKVYLYEKPSGISSTNAYQSAADSYNIFMSELRCIWKKEISDILITDKIINEKVVNKDKDLHMKQMYELCQSLHKRSRSEQGWNDMQTAFNTSFGQMAQMKNKNNNSNRNNHWNSSGNHPGNVSNNYMTPQQQQPSNTYNLRSRSQSRRKTL